MKDARDALLVARNTEGRMVQRPLSPHLQVYRPQISTVLSIMHRATGIALSAGAVLLVWWLAAGATSPEAFEGVQWFLDSALGWLLLFGWTVALFYHFFAGLRHLGWDAGWGYDKPHYYYTGYAVLIATGVCTLLVWIVGLTLK